MDSGLECATQAKAVDMGPIARKALGIDSPLPKVHEARTAINGLQGFLNANVLPSSDQTKNRQRLAKTKDCPKLQLV